MGIEYRIAAAQPPSWTGIVDLLASKNYPVQMRMIDGQLAFPDEQPPEDWRELRVGTPGGMISLRREGDAIKIVTWGNADAKMLAAWNSLAWATATLANAPIESEKGSRTASEFQTQENLPF